MARNGSLLSRRSIALTAILTLATFTTVIHAAPSPKMTDIAVPPPSDDPAASLVDMEVPQTTEPPNYYKFYAPHELKRRHDEDSGESEKDSSSTEDKDASKTSTHEDHGATKTEEHKTTEYKDIRPTSTTSVEKSKTLSSGIIESASSIELTTSTSASVVATNMPLPSAFDGSSTTDFQSGGSTDSCPTFMKNLLDSPDFQACYPLSMMLQVRTTQ